MGTVERKQAFAFLKTVFIARWKTHWTKGKNSNPLGFSRFSRYTVPLNQIMRTFTLSKPFFVFHCKENYENETYRSKFLEYSPGRKTFSEYQPFPLRPLPLSPPRPPKVPPKEDNVKIASAAKNWINSAAGMTFWLCFYLYPSSICKGDSKMASVPHAENTFFLHVKKTQARGTQTRKT